MFQESAGVLYSVSRVRLQSAKVPQQNGQILLFRLAIPSPQLDGILCRSHSRTRVSAQKIAIGQDGASWSKQQTQKNPAISDRARTLNNSLSAKLFPEVSGL